MSWASGCTLSFWGRVTPSRLKPSLQSPRICQISRRRVTTSNALVRRERLLILVAEVKDPSPPGLLSGLPELRRRQHFVDQGDASFQPSATCRRGSLATAPVGH